MTPRARPSPSRARSRAPGCSGPGRATRALGLRTPSSSPRVGARCLFGRARPATIPAYSAGDAAGLADGRRTALRSRPSLRSAHRPPRNPPAPAPRTPAPVGFAAAVVESLGLPGRVGTTGHSLVPDSRLFGGRSETARSPPLGISPRSRAWNILSPRPPPSGSLFPLRGRRSPSFASCPRNRSTSRQPSTAVTPCNSLPGPCPFAR